MTFLGRFMFPLPLLLCASLAFTQADTAITNTNVTFTTIDVPGAVATDVEGINSIGDMVGGYAPNSTSSEGFVYSGGNFTLFSYPGGDSTSPRGINDAGVIVGWAYVKQATAAVTFLYDGTTFTTVRAPGRSATFREGINNSGELVGGDGSLAATQGFERIGSRFKKVSPPGNYIYVYGTGINNFGEIGGLTTGGVGSDNGFVYKGGKFQTISFPGASTTETWGINDNGIIVGWYGTQTSFSGFALMSGRYMALNYPGASATFAFGINASGQIVGAYTLGNVTHGFVTSPITATDFEQPGCCVTNETAH